MARALRFQSGLPLQYWGDCVMCVVHITNRLPSKVLAEKTPYEVLYLTSRVYTHLKTFGCLVLASNPNRKKDKFSARGVPCVFLGYPQSQKAYKLLNLTNNVIFVSRDVKFYETSFPFKIFHNNKTRETVNVSGNTPCDDEKMSEENVELENEPQHAPHTEIRRSNRTHKTPTWHQDYITTPQTQNQHLTLPIFQIQNLFSFTTQYKPIPTPYSHVSSLKQPT